MGRGANAFPRQDKGALIKFKSLARALAARLASFRSQRQSTLIPRGSEPPLARARPIGIDGSADGFGGKGSMMLRTIVLALGCVFALSPSWAQTVPAAPDARPAGPPLRNAAPPLEDTASPAFQARQSWRRTMAQKPTPKPGCFSTKFPSTEWTETPCSNALPLPHPFRLGQDAVSTGGGGPPTTARSSRAAFPPYHLDFRIPRAGRRRNERIRPDRRRPLVAAT